MSYKTVFKDIMREYESDRDRAANLLKERREEVYRYLPGVKEIDEELSQIGISVAKRLLKEGADTKSLIENMKKHSEKLKAEKEHLLSEIGVSNNYFNAIYRCNLCEDTGYLTKELSRTNRCQCLKRRLIDKYYDLSSIRGLLEAENFDTFDIRYYSDEILPSEGISPKNNMELIFKNAMKFVDDFGQTFQNLLFYGETGMGKTFLCNCIAKDLLDRGHTVLYVTAPRIFKLVEDYRFNRDEMEDPNYAIDAVTDVDLLILDDLGAEFSTLVTNSTLFDIINQRLLAKLPTVISTNLQLAELETHYTERIISRFFGNYKISKFFGDDIRLKKKYKNA
ncbi:MAG: ATP-binding protein [Defluviitaleaceae bacterium]|nr:ATP-binding protein [Defluviitaleaceae bacterium]